MIPLSNESPPTSTKTIRKPDQALRAEVVGWFSTDYPKSVLADLYPVGVRRDKNHWVAQLTLAATQPSNPVHNPPQHCFALIVTPRPLSSLFIHAQGSIYLDHDAGYPLILLEIPAGNTCWEPWF